MKRILNYKFTIIIVIALTTLTSCESNQTIEEIDDVVSSNISNNTIQSDTSTGNLNLYSFTNYSLANGEIFEFIVYEKEPTVANNFDFGTYTKIFIKNLPTGTTTYNHRQEAEFALETSEYYLGDIKIGNKPNTVWHVPFVNSRITNVLDVKVENGVANFSIVDAELSNNAVNPITETKIFSLSFSINLSELVMANANQSNNLVN